MTQAKGAILILLGVLVSSSCNRTTEEPTYSLGGPGLPLIKSDNKAYFFSSVYKGTRQQVKFFCKKLSMQLISIESKKENDFLAENIPKQFVTSDNGKDIWTSAERTGDDFAWGNENPMDYKNWKDEEPDETIDYVIATFQQNKLEWIGAEPSKKGNVICETRIHTDDKY